MQLVTVDTVLNRLALQAQADDENFIATVNDAIYAVTIYMMAQLDTEFDEDDYTDTFYLDRNVYQAFGGIARLKLSNGFVDGNTLVLSGTSNLFDSSSVPVQLTAQQILVSPKLLEKGFIDISADFMGQYVTVAYSAGIPDPTSVPDWLQEAAIGHFINVMSWQQVGDAKPALGKILDEVGKHKGAILNRHMRTSSAAIPPIRST